VASNYPDEGLPANEDGDFRADLPSRMSGTGHPAHTEARAELRDRETYYAELRFAVHCQSRSIPLPRAALDDQETDKPKRRPDDESWDDMTARFGDTWT
jgi:hypothetical protein